MSLTKKQFMSRMTNAEKSLVKLNLKIFHDNLLPVMSLSLLRAVLGQAFWENSKKINLIHSDIALTRWTLIFRFSDQCLCMYNLK